MPTYKIIKKDNTEEHSIIFNCECLDLTHSVKLSYDKLPDDENILNAWNFFIVPQLNHYLSFWRRIIVAIKFIFKKESFSYADAILNYDDVIELKKFCEDYLELNKEVNEQYKSKTDKQSQDNKKLLLG